MTYVVEIATGRSRPVVELRGPAAFSVADGGRVLYSLRSQEDSEVWLLTLAEPAATAER